MLLRSLLRLFPVLLLLMLCGSAWAQTVSTNKSDYAPGETVQISGGGFHANETITLQVVHTDGTNDLGDPDHQPWPVLTDDSGNFTSSWALSAADVGGSSFKLTADCADGLHAETTFTDAEVPASVQTSPADATVTEGQTASFTASAQGTPPPSVQWQVSTNGGASFSNIAGGTSTTVAGVTTNTLTFTALLSQNGYKLPRGIHQHNHRPWGDQDQP
jgi:hypothetical protein